MRIVLVLIVLLLSAGCGGGDSNDAATTTGPAGKPADIEVFASEFAFAPPFVVIEKPGTYTISLRNDGNVPHNLTIKGLGATDDVQPGDTGTLTVTVKPGGYPMVCSIHKAEGMDGEVIVYGG